MQRALLPFIFASIGFAMIVQATAVISFFEWQISDVTTDFPSLYEVDYLPSPWQAQLGDSFDDGSYVFSKVSVLKDRRSCLREDLNFVAKRSQTDKALEETWLNAKRSFSWLLDWSLIEVVVSGIYIVWFTLWHEQRSVVHTVVLLGIAMCIFLFLTQLLRLEGPLFSPYYSGRVDCYHGTVIFNARLLKVRYETLVVLFVGILAELGALGTMVRQIMKAIMQRKESAQSAVG